MIGWKIPDTFFMSFRGSPWVSMGVLDGSGWDGIGRNFDTPFTMITA